MWCPEFQARYNIEWIRFSRKSLLIKIYVTISHAANERRMRKAKKKVCLLAGSQPSLQWTSCSSQSDTVIINAANFIGQNWLALCWRGVRQMGGKYGENSVTFLLLSQLIKLKWKKLKHINPRILSCWLPEHKQKALFWVSYNMRREHVVFTHIQKETGFNVQIWSKLMCYINSKGRFLL